MSRHSAPTPCRSPRAGFTLLEALLAVVMVNVGLLALVACTAFLVQARTELRTRAVALSVAQMRLQLLGAAACAPASGSATGPLGVRDQWTVVIRKNHIRELADSVTFLVRTETRTLTLRTRLPC